MRVPLYSLLGSRGPSTVTFMARWYVATCGGLVNTVIVNVKLLPVVTSNNIKWHTICEDNDLHSSLNHIQVTSAVVTYDNSQ